MRGLLFLALACSAFGNSIETVAACLSLEAANQGEEGMRAVACVIKNRAEYEGRSFEEIVLNSKLGPFCSMRAGATASITKAKHDKRFACVWPRAMRISRELHEGKLGRTLPPHYVFFENLQAYGRPKHYRAGGITVRDQYFWALN